MADQKWMDAGAACAALGVRRQTLYAYVSRGLLQACSDPNDPRKSLYLQRDVVGLAAKHRRPRARADVAAAAIRWGDPVLETRISEVRDGVLYFGDRIATDLAKTLSLEDVAARHWGVSPRTIPAEQTGFQGTTPLERAMSYLVAEAASSPAMAGRSRPQIAAEGAHLVRGLIAAFLDAPVSGDPAHRMLSRAWQASDAAADIIRQALVLLSDHDLNPSTFAVRVCASTGASLPAALLAGLATLSGPRHGGVAHEAALALTAAATKAGANRFVESRANADPYGFGFGHPHYPEGDCRAAHLLGVLGTESPSVAAARRMASVIGQPPNIDAALAALTQDCALPQEAAFLIFAIGRSVGWIAHAIEQIESGEIIRPRARFRL